MQDELSPPLLTVAQVAEWLNVPEGTVVSAYEAGDIFREPGGRRVMFSQDSVQAYVARCKSDGRDFPPYRASTKGRSNGPTSLYRFYAGDDTLLYVGVTSQGTSRFRSHADRKDGWFRSAVRCELEHFDTRLEAEAAERRQIKTLHPVHNIVHAAVREGVLVGDQG